MVPLEPRRNSTPFFCAAAHSMTKIYDFRAYSMLSSLMTWSIHSSKRRPLRWTSSKRQIMKVIEVDHVEETNSEGHWGKTSSEGTVPMFKKHNVGTVPTFKMHNVGTVPTYKTHNVGTVPTYNLMEDNLSGRMTFKGGRPLAEDNLWRKTIFDGRRPLREDKLWWKRTFERRLPLMEDNLCRKTTFDSVYSILPEKNVYDSSPWQSQHNWPQTGNSICCLKWKYNFTWWKKCTRH